MEKLTGCRIRSSGTRQQSTPVAKRGTVTKEHTRCQIRQSRSHQHPTPIGKEDQSWIHSPTVRSGHQDHVITHREDGDQSWRNSQAVKLGHQYRINTRNPLEVGERQWRNLLAVG